MSIVRTTKQARGLQRCSTRPCDCCGKDSRGYLFGEVHIETWLPSNDGLSMQCCDRYVRRQMIRVCAKHKNAKGVFIRPRDSGQIGRVVIHWTAP